MLEIAQHFVRTRNFHRNVEKELDARALAVIRGYAWPGNVRELKNVIERAVLLSGQTPAIKPVDLGLSSKPTSHNGNGIGFSFDHLPTMDEIQTHYVEMLLDRPDASRAMIAHSLGISERTVYRILQSRKHK